VEQLIVFSAKYFFALAPFVATVFFFMLKKNLKIKFLALSALSLSLSLSLAKLLNKIIVDPRPFVVNHIQPLIPHAPDNGFPSDHTLLVATIASIVFVFNKKLGIVIMVLAVIVGYSRVLAQIHHPLDIAGSVLIAVVATWASRLILTRLNFNSKFENSMKIVN